MSKDSTSPDIAAILGKSLLFGALDEGGRRELAARVHRRSFNVGEPIFHIGDPGQSMMVILAGTVRVSLPGPRGKGVILADLGAGELLGEIALLDGRERSADVTALTKCELLVLERRDVVAFLEKRADVCLKLLELVCAKLRKSDQRMSDIAFLELSERLAKLLMERIGPAGRAGSWCRGTATSARWSVGPPCYGWCVAPARRRWSTSTPAAAAGRGRSVTRRSITRCHVSSASRDCSRPCAGRRPRT